MSSVVKNMMRDAAPALTEALGERDAKGKLVELDYQPPGTADVVKLIGWTTGQITTRTEMSPLAGQLETVELMPVSGPRNQLESKGIAQVQVKAVVTIGKQQWNIDAETSSWRSNFVTLGLRRAMLNTFHEGRHANV